MNAKNDRANSGAECPTPADLHEFVSGALRGENEQRIVLHIEFCAVCASKLDSNEGDEELDKLLRASSGAAALSIPEAERIRDVISRPAESAGRRRSSSGRFQFKDRELGKGGMGIVHEAVDAEMRRNIAVKRLRDEFAADRKNIKQFENEARVTGLLEHPGIVPVYGRGRDRRGRPFYAMRMVEGERLTAAVNRLHDESETEPTGPRATSELRRLLTRFVAICNTVAYAHQKGFIHLDIKPSNILLGPFGETFMMDWGSAMKLGRPIRRSSGTVPYMSPEQGENRLDQIGPASDVHALGATLFTIVSGRKPDQDDWTVGPEAPTGFPKPLYAICRKAMERNPENRYPSPLALAEDVERWLADEPTSVLPNPWTEHVARWMRRHRSATTAAMLILASMTVAATVTAGVVSLARAGERRAMARAESRADLAVDAVRKFRDVVSSDLDVRNRPELAPLRKNLLAEPLKFFEQIRDDLQRNRDASPATTLRLGKANRDLAILVTEIDSTPNAVRAYEQAVATLDPLVASPRARQDRDAREAQRVLVECLGRLGLAQRDLGKVQEARESLRRALGVCDQNAPDQSSPEDQIIRARTLDRLAMIETPESPDVAVALLEQAVAVLQPLAVDGLVVPSDPPLLALIDTHLGSALRARKRLPEAAKRFQEAISAFEALVRASPENYAYRSNLAAVSFNLANLHLQIKNRAGAVAGFERARDLWEGLAREIPTASVYHASLVGAYGTLGILHQNANRLDDARVAMNRSREIGEGLVRVHPTVLKYRADLGRTYINLSVLESKVGRPKEAVALLAPARDCLREVFLSRSGDPLARHGLATACAALGDGLVELGRDAEALESFRECAELAVELERLKDPRFPTSRELLKNGLLGVARCQRRLGRVLDASAAAEQWNAHWNGDPEDLVEIARELTLCSVSAKDETAIKRYADQAMEFLRKAIAAGYRLTKSLRTDEDFSALRPRADFIDLVADAGFPSDPFAR
jgi:eukaryotic-like serine/threonine-protein kinase